jgi:hypothetical protein
MHPHRGPQERQHSMQTGHGFHIATTIQVQLRLNGSVRVAATARSRAWNGLPKPGMPAPVRTPYAAC